MEITKTRDLGRVIRARRRELGWSQAKLADEVGTTRRWVSEIEHGKSTAEVGLVLATLQALDLSIHLDQPGTRTEAPESSSVMTQQPSAEDLEEVLSRHVESGARKTRPVTFRRTNRP